MVLSHPSIIFFKLDFFNSDARDTDGDIDMISSINLSIDLLFPRHRQALRLEEIELENYHQEVRQHRLFCTAVRSRSPYLP